MFIPHYEHCGLDGKDGALMDREERRKMTEELWKKREQDWKANRYQRYSELLGVCWGLLPTETDERVQNALETTIEVVAHKMGFEIIEKWVGDLKATETTDEPAESEGGAK